MLSVLSQILNLNGKYNDLHNLNASSKNESSCYLARYRIGIIKLFNQCVVRGDFLGTYKWQSALVAGPSICDL